MNDKLTIVYCLNYFSQIETHLAMNGHNLSIVQCFGITKDPETKNFMMVMRYAEHGNLRQYLNNSFNSLSWHDKLRNLCRAAVDTGFLLGKPAARKTRPCWRGHA